MKKYRLLTLLLALVLLASLLAGCAAETSNGKYDADYGSGEQAPEDSLSGSLSSGIATDRKLIRRISMTAETEDMDALLTRINSRVKELGGYIESREVYSGSSYDTGRRRYANMTIRIPAEQRDAFVEDVSGASNIVSASESSDDVTLEYVATESHLKVLQAEEERLLAFLAEAKSVSEMLEIEARLTDVRAELETITTQLNTYDNLVDYATVSLSISEVQQLTVVEEEEPGLWQRISSGFMESVHNLCRVMEELLVFSLTNLPYLLPLLVVGIVALVVWRLATRKSRRRRPHRPAAS